MLVVCYVSVSLDSKVTKVCTNRMVLRYGTLWRKINAPIPIFTGCFSYIDKVGEQVAKAAGPEKLHFLNVEVD